MFPCCHNRERIENVFALMFLSREKGIGFHLEELITKMLPDVARIVGSFMLHFLSAYPTSSSTTSTDFQINGMTC